MAQRFTIGLNVGSDLGSNARAEHQLQKEIDELVGLSEAEHLICTALTPIHLDLVGEEFRIDACLLNDCLPILLPLCLLRFCCRVLPSDGLPFLPQALQRPALSPSGWVRYVEW